MKLKLIGALGALAILGWFIFGPSDEPVAGRAGTTQGEKIQGASSRSDFSIGRVTLSHPAGIDEDNEDRRFTRFLDGVSYWHQTVKLSAELHQQDQEAARDLEIINEILGVYRLLYQENPVGTDNEEFAMALAGENPKKVVFIDPKLLVDGELLDRYGFPYHFHPLKADVMGLRSRGPDGQLWTDDDISLDVGGVESELGLVRE